MESRGPQRSEQPGRRATPQNASARLPGSRAEQRAEATRKAALPLWRRLPIILGVATGIGLCLIVLFVSFLLMRAQPTLPDATPAARSLCADLQMRDYTAAYTLLSTRLRAQGTAAQFAASQRRLDIQRGQVTSCTPTVQHTEAAQAAVSITLARGTTAAQNASITLIYEAGAWVVDAYDPDLV
jgi:hypothetical protein